MSKKILVTGATGQLGREVVNQLLDKVKANDIHALVRDTAKADDLKSKGVSLVKGDYTNYESLVDAFTGVEKLYFVSSSDVMNRLTQHENVVKAADAAKVGHIFYTSAQRKSEDGTSPIGIVGDAHWKTDILLKKSGLTYTILKHALYADILPMFMGEKVLETGIYLPAGDGKVSFATRKDMASVASVVLTTAGHENKVYEIAGETSYSFKDVAEILSDLSGKNVAYISPSAEEFSEVLRGKGLPEQMIMGTVTFCQAIAQGEFDFPNGTLKKLLGRDPQSVRDYLKTAYKL
jgi:NAD(P)H dehydrogenase (quinone)